MSEIRTDLLGNRLGTGPATLHKQWASKGWLNFDGGGPTIRDSENFSSITDNGAGDFTPNITSAMAAVSYSAVGTAGEGGDGRCDLSFDATTARTVSLFRFDVINHGNAARVDAAQINCVIHGDLA
ncbi:putative alpha amylase [Microcystis phage Mel-JY33]